MTTETIIGSFACISPDATMSADFVGKCGRIIEARDGMYLVSMEEGSAWFFARNIDVLHDGDEIKITRCKWKEYNGKIGKVKVNGIASFGVSGTWGSVMAESVVKIHPSPMNDESATNKMFAEWTSTDKNDAKKIKTIKNLDPLAGLNNIHITIENADKLDMTPEEFELQRQKNARSLNNLMQDHPGIRNKHTDM